MRQIRGPAARRIAYHELTTNVLVSIAIGLGAAVSVAAPAGANPSSFGALSCSCRQTATSTSRAATDPVNLGIQQALSDLRPSRGGTHLSPVPS